MLISNLTLQQFRSYRKATFQFSPSVTLIIGPNASGKTNILEAIYSLAIGKSFQAEKESDMIFWREEVARVRAKISEETTLELVITMGEVNGEKAPIKKYVVNGVSRRQVDFVGNIRAVLFCPSDLEIVTDSPSLRRSYLNSVLVQTDREYRRNLFSYERGLRQRNKLLDLIRDEKADRSQLVFWNQLLIKSGSYLTESRHSYIDFVNSFPLSARLPAGQDFNYQVVYEESVISQPRLDQYKDEEVAAGATLVGPQRDDFIIMKNQKSIRQPSDKDQKEEDEWRDVSRFGSRGEQRLAILWLKLAELEYIKSQVEEKPLLLLDDIFSELDEESRKIVLSIIEKQQTIITSAEEDMVELFKKIGDIKIIRLPIE